MLRMSTEEALNNAESYAQLVQVLAGVTVDPIPSDTVSGCTDAGPLLDAMALAQSAHRRAWSYLQEAQNALNTGGTIEPWLRTLIDRFLNTPSDALLASLLMDFGNLQREATVWHLGHTFSCAPASSCPAGALAFDDRRIYRNGSVVPRRRSAIHNPRICAAFFALAADERARVAHVIVSLSFGDFFLCIQIGPGAMRHWLWRSITGISALRPPPVWRNIRPRTLHLQPTQGRNRTRNRQEPASCENTRPITEERCGVRPRMWRSPLFPSLSRRGLRRVPCRDRSSTCNVRLAIRR